MSTTADRLRGRRPRFDLGSLPCRPGMSIWQDWCPSGAQGRDGRGSRAGHPGRARCAPPPLARDALQMPFQPCDRLVQVLAPETNPEVVAGMPEP